MMASMPDGLPFVPGTGDSGAERCRTLANDRWCLMTHFSALHQNMTICPI